MDECLANRLKSSTVTEVCRGIAKSFDREYLVVQITSVIDGAVRPECLFAYNRRPHRIERTRECDQLESRYYISNYGKLPRTEISECRTENKELSSLSGASTDGSQFEVEP